MNASFGIDHPLIAVRDIHRLRELLIAMGFNMTAIGKHPWGTSTSLAMFQGCLIEIMGIYDEGLLDEVPAGDFRFGRHIYDHLQVREGVALTALHSTDSLRDAKTAAKAGYTVAGHLEFGRDVSLPDGAQGRTKTTLALLPDCTWPRLSFFLCQQHRPELIYVPQWLEHENTVFGMCGTTILATESEHAALQAKLSALYGTVRACEGGFVVQTANGVLRVLTREAVIAEFGPLPEDVDQDHQPAIIAMDLKFREWETLRMCLGRSGVGFKECDAGFDLSNSTRTGNTFLRFRKG
ncbi:VOC family protein [Litoreibacter janthinus]|uniref:Glyoxalase-like domain-containing protein n=1 Tax=Litoreibacter janthinus TaxID=670154 RepID=A0A1I6G4U7_9RHOB|nr:VOC family protein [Litoreibacter janthinus]SFR37192.1 Glyoxalase-like domain-containing protein [Litoreibacter janthinus]